MTKRSDNYSFLASHKFSVLSCIGTIFHENKSLWSRFIVDSGSGLSIINLSLVQAFGLKIDKSKKITLRTVTGDQGTTVGSVAGVSMQFGKLTIKHDFHVMSKIPYDCLLGNDFLAKNGANMDFSTGVMTLGQENISVLFRSPSKSEKTSCVIVPSKREVRNSVEKLKKTCFSN